MSVYREVWLYVLIAVSVLAALLGFIIEGVDLVLVGLIASGGVVCALEIYLSRKGFIQPEEPDHSAYMGM